MANERIGFSVSLQPADYAPVFLRVAVGATFIYHGFGKVFEGGASGLAAGLGWGALSVPMAWAAALSEFFGGICLVLGLYTRIAAFLIGCVMTVAILKVHLGNGFSQANYGYEWQLLLLCSCISLILTGGRAASLDRVLGERRKG